MSCNPLKERSKIKIAKSLEKLFCDFELTGDLNLSGRNLKDFPEQLHYELSDLITIDLSKNCFSKIPEILFNSYFLESLNLYCNQVKCVPQSVINLKCLVYLNLSRNQLTIIPDELCHLPIQILRISNNKLVSLPEEISCMQSLQQLDVSCNELAHLPQQIGNLQNLKSLNLRRNYLIEIPHEITRLSLEQLDLSENRITRLPLEMRHMTSLIALNVNDNPLSVPPVAYCRRGLAHVFKFLEVQAVREERRKYSCEKNIRLRKVGASNLGYSEIEHNRVRAPLDGGYGSCYLPSNGSCTPEQVSEAGLTSLNAKKNSTSSFIKPISESTHQNTVFNRRLTDQKNTPYQKYVESSHLDENIHRNREYKEALKAQRAKEQKKKK